MTPSSNGHQEKPLTYDSFNGTKKPRSTHFLWWCAGAHQALLKEFDSEHAKYAGLGGVILATFFLASLSAGYAFYSVFNEWTWALGFAAIWGLIIFNFDRFLVSTMRKYGLSLRKQIWMTIPRLLLALLIGITIARPLELKIFEKEINVKVAENRHKKILLNDSLLTEENKNILAMAGQERSSLATRKLSIEDTLHRLQNAYLTEADGTGGSMQRGIDRLTRLKEDAYLHALVQYSPELQMLNGKIAYQDSILNNAVANKESKRKQYEATVSSNVGFLERNKALSDLSNEESSVWLASVFISLLIILIETGPVLSKLIMSPGPYDVALAKTELLQMAKSENEMQRDKTLLLDKLDGLYRRKKEMSDEMLGHLTDLQRKHINQEIDRWERGERASGNRTGLDELMKKIKEQYEYKEENVI